MTTWIGGTGDGPALHDVSCEPVGQRWTLVFSRPMRHPAQQVWPVLTDPDRLARWAPYTTDRPLESIGPIQVLDNQDPDAAAIPGQVTRCDPPTLLEHSWRVDVLRWQLAPDDGRTRLTLRHTLDERHAVPDVAAGWHLCLDVAAELLDGRPTGPILGEAATAHGWQALADGYATLLGIYQNPRR